MTRPESVAAYVPDMMDRSRLSGLGAVRFVSDPAELVAQGAEVVVLDLSRDGVLDVLPALASARTVGFGSHVDRERLDAARAAGCDVVLTRSVFFARPDEAVDVPRS